MSGFLTRLRTACIALLFLPAGCEAPPPAPEGLDASVRYLLEHFYDDDEHVGAGLTGLRDWMDAEGSDLLEVDPEVGNVADFQLSPLDAEVVADLPVAARGQDVSEAAGVVGISELGCSAQQAERLLIRADQDVVFEGEWTRYERTFESERAPFEEAVGGPVSPIDEPLDVFSDDFDPAAAADGLLLTSNRVGTSDFSVEFDYTLNLHHRHCTFDVQGEPTPSLLILSWLPDQAVASNGSDLLRQVYSLDVVMQPPGRGTTRLVATWNHVEATLGSDSPLVQTLSVDRILRFGARLSDICEGTVDLPPEG